MSAQQEVARLVPGDNNVQAGSSTSAVDGGGGGSGASGSYLPAPNEHMYVGRTPSTSSCTRSVRSAKGCTVHIKEPPETDTRRPSSSPPTAAAATAANVDEHGPLHHAIPVMPLALAVACCVMNILLPGVGTYVIPHMMLLLPDRKCAADQLPAP